MKVHKTPRVLFLVLCLSIAAGATQDGASSSGKPAITSVAGQSQSKPTNLKVLPKETSAQEVYQRMASMQRDLGVQCGFCHEQDPDTKQFDFTSDENPRKETARLMMRMTDDINQKYLGQLGDRQYAAPITCGNCHLGQMHPPPYDPANAK